MLSSEKKFLFIHVPKTAGNSIQDALRSYSDDEIISVAPYHDGVERFALRSTKYKTMKHSTYFDYQIEYGADLMNSLFKFTCIRNPWDRCMSHFFSPHRGQVEWNKEDFVRFVGEVVKPISFYISSGKILQPIEVALDNIDYIIRYEMLIKDIGELVQRLDLRNFELAHRNSSTNLNPRRFYDSASVRFVNDFFMEEIEYFKYSF